MPRKAVEKYADIAWTWTYRGEKDNYLTFLFRGVKADALGEVFSFLCAKGNGICKKFRIRKRLEQIKRNGYPIGHFEVELQEPNYRFASLTDILILIEAQLRRQTEGYVDLYRINDFLNLSRRNPKRILNTATAIVYDKEAQRQIKVITD